MSERLGTSDIARLLRVSRPRVWQLRKREDFPDPAGRDDQGREYWYENQIMRWAAGAGRTLAERAPLLFRPVPGNRAAYYLGTSMVDGYVVLSWDSQLGRIGFLYAPRGLMSGAIDRVLERVLARTGVDALVGMDAGHYNPWGPELRAVDATAPGQHYDPRWTDLARVLSMPAPYWPGGLVQPEEMAKWKPGAPPAVLPPRHDELDLAPLLRLVADSDDGCTAGRAALHLARAITAQAAAGARSDIELLQECHDRDAIALAATVLEASEVSSPPEEVLRDGWMQILTRTDPLACDCVELALKWDGGRYFPFSTTAHLRPKQSAEAAAWAATLVPAEPTAASTLFKGWSATRHWTDPATGLPAITDPQGELYAAVPQRLPALAPLQQVVLRDHQVWIRTQDGTLFLAPEQSGCGISWGYNGSGPLALAIVLNRLLDDINAPAPARLSDEASAVAPGLLHLVEKVPRDEAIFTRDQLLAARQPS